MDLLKRSVRAYLLVIISFLFVTSCGEQRQNDSKIDSQMAKVVSRFTTGDIDPTDEIKIEFQKVMISQDLVGESLNNSPFKFSPSIKGKAYWSNRSTLNFAPQGDLELWEKYQAVVDLSNVVTDSLGDYNLRFSFNVEGQRVKNLINEVSLYDPNDPKWMKFETKLELRVHSSIEKVKEAVEVAGVSVDFNVAQIDKEGYSFLISSDKMERGNSTKNCALILDADILGMKEDYRKDFVIGAMSRMDLVEINKDLENRIPKINLVFSDEFDNSQDLNGLIKIKPEIDFEIKRSGKRIILDGDFSYGDSYKIIVAKGVRSKWGNATEKQVVNKVNFPNVKPQVEFLSNGVISPLSNDYKIQFYTNNLQRVHIELKKVYSDDVHEFINIERLNSVKDRKQAFQKAYINRTGVIVHNESFEITSDKNNWKLNEIDLSEVVQKDKSALYLVRLNFNKRDILVEDGKYLNDSYIESNAQVYKPVWFSDIGITAKRLKKGYKVFVTDLKSGKPKSGVSLSLRREYYYRDNDKVVSSALSSSDGTAYLPHHDRYYGVFILAEFQGQRSVIKFDEMRWNSSGFDIGGVDHNQETRAFTYTERGVYRPGDEVNVSVIARHRDLDFPSNRMLTMDLYNPKGKKVYSQNSRENKGGFFTFKFQTQDSDPTGTWRAEYRLGNSWYSHAVKIETIVPFKLKVRMNPEKEVIDFLEDSLKATLNSKYLFGTPSKGLDAEVEMELSHKTKRFKDYADFSFSNPDYSYQQNQYKIFEGKVDDQGNAKIREKLPLFLDVPSAISMKLTSKVYEKGGRPNINTKFITVDPYEHYVGIQGDRYSYFESGSDIELPVVLCDVDGKPVVGRQLTYRIYFSEKSWWWHYDHHGNARFKTSDHTVLLEEGKVETGQTPASIKFVPVELGTYFVEVVDENGSGHSTGYRFSTYRYGGVPSGKDAGTLQLMSDKKSYQVGDVATVKFPIPKKGTALLTIEQGQEIITQEWHEVSGEKFMEVKVPITKEMVPNAYAVVSLMQPHLQTQNDRPIRMYGILPFDVVDPKSKTKIDIITNKFFRPKEDFTVEVQMSNHKKTQFTIAVVDEGLLDITNFKTPEPWSHFYQKTRLDLQTWDMYSHVINANKGDVFKTFAIGGDMDYRKSQDKPDKGKKRFKPVSIFKGVLETDENGYSKIEFKMPNYIGSVRIMVVAAEEELFASQEKAVPVKSELMIMPSLPRVLGPAEIIDIPVTVFAMEDNIGKVEVKVETEGPLEVEKSTEMISFAKKDDQDCFFRIKVKDGSGQSKITISAKSQDYFAEEITNLMVRPTATRKFESIEEKITKGQSWDLKVPKIGIDGSNNATLVLSPFPNINFGKRLRNLIRYPYGCLEQTTSAVFPQIYLSNFIQYPEAFESEIKENVNRGLQKLRSFQRFEGNLSYWPYSQKVNSWANLYAGHFMISAKKAGYHVANDLYENWIKFVSGEARRSKGSYQQRAYQIYLLALAERASLAEMNILRESHLDKLSNVQKWLLAASYKLAGQANVAASISRNLSTEVESYQLFEETFGSSIRDLSLILEAAVILEKFDLADQLASTISKRISSSSYYSTHSMGVAIMAMGKYCTHLSKGAQAKVVGKVVLESGKEIPFEAKRASSIHLVGNFGKSAKVIFSDESTVDNLYATLSYNGVPLHDDIVDQDKNISLKVTYFNEEGETINPNELKQGYTFYAHYKVQNLSAQALRELALVQILPSGWEVENMRLLGQNLPSWMNEMSISNGNYQDIRDDRVMWFFDLCQPSRYCDSKKEFILKINAVTTGEFEMPGTLVEAMYNNEFKSTRKGMKVKVLSK